VILLQQIVTPEITEIFGYVRPIFIKHDIFSHDEYNIISNTDIYVHIQQLFLLTLVKDEA
jgi:hypothetical protein